MPRIIKVLDTPEKLVLRALVTPFGDESHRDFSGEFFHKNTYFGDDIGVKEKIGFYEHNINGHVNPHQPPAARAILGKATLAKIDEAGRWYDFEMSRLDPYTRYVEDLFINGWLGASSQAFMGTKVMDAKVKGKIDSWIEAEPSLTPTPDNPATIFDDDQIKSIQSRVKSLSPLLWSVVNKSTEVPVISPIAVVPTPAVDPVVIASHVDAILDEPEKPAETDAPTLNDDVATIAALRQELDEEKAKNAALTVSVAAIAEDVKAFKESTRKELDTLSGDVVKTATYIKRKVTEIVDDAKTWSDQERSSAGLDAKKKDTGSVVDTEHIKRSDVGPTGMKKAFGGKGPGSRA